MTFGRPTMTMNIPSSALAESNHSNADNVEQMKLHFQHESVRLSSILESILSKVYKPWQSRHSQEDHSAIPYTGAICQSMDVFAELHGRLASFELSVPSFLSWKTPMRIESVSADDSGILALQRNVLHLR